MVIIKIKDKEFSIEENILENNKNFLVTIDLKNKEMIKEFDYPEHNPYIFEKFVIPLLEEKLNMERLSENIFEMINNKCIDTYYGLLFLEELLNEIEEELNFFGFNSMKNILRIDENMKDSIVIKSEFRKTIYEIENLIIEINYKEDIVYKKQRDPTLIKVDKILINYFNMSEKINLQEIKCLWISLSGSGYIVYDEKMINSLYDHIKNKTVTKIINDFIKDNKLIKYYSNCNISNYTKRNDFSFFNKKKIFDEDDINRLLIGNESKNDIFSKHLCIYEVDRLIRTLK